jgi:hypothetical protein
MPLQPGTGKAHVLGRILNKRSLSAVCGAVAAYIVSVGGTAVRDAIEVSQQPTNKPMFGYWVDWRFDAKMSLFVAGPIWALLGAIAGLACSARYRARKTEAPSLSSNASGNQSIPDE